MVGHSFWLEAFFVRHIDVTDGGDYIYDSEVDLSDRENLATMTTTTTTNTGSPSFLTQRKDMEKGFHILYAKPEKLENLMGNDAVQYLRFQMYLMAYLLFCCVVACGIILPVNLQVMAFFSKFLHFLYQKIYCLLSLFFMKIPYISNT